MCVKVLSHSLQTEDLSLLLFLLWTRFLCSRYSIWFWNIWTQILHVLNKTCESISQFSGAHFPRTMNIILNLYWQRKKGKVNFVFYWYKLSKLFCFIYCHCIWWRNHLGNWGSFVGLLATSSFAIYYDSSRQPRQWRSICYCPQENREIFFVYFEFNKFEFFQFSNKVFKLC